METDFLRGADRDGYDASLDAAELHLENVLADAPVHGGRGGAVTGYAGPGKAKARMVCQAFVDGAGGGRVHQPPTRSLDSAGRPSSA